MNSKLPYAESVPYFQTSRTAADTWIDRAKRELAGVGGKVIAEAFGVNSSGEARFELTFTIGPDRFRLSWPVLPSKTGKDKAAKIQAATALYHDVKARVVSAKFLGVRAAFANFALLPNGQTIGETDPAELLGSSVILLGPGGQDGRNV